MITEQYVVTCNLENDQVGYKAANAFDYPPNTYNFYGIREIGKLAYYEDVAQKYAWDLARMIANSPEYADLKRIFGVGCVKDVLNMPFDTVMKICQKWDDRIKVGDVCLAKRSDGKTELVVVISAGDPESPDVLVLRKNLQTVLVDKDNLEQTGDNLADELNHILKVLKEDGK